MDVALLKGVGRIQEPALEVGRDTDGLLIGKRLAKFGWVAIEHPQKVHAFIPSAVEATQLLPELQNRLQ